MKILVTGGCGFIGSYFISYLLRKDPKIHVLNLDALTYAAHPDTNHRLVELGRHRYEFIHADLTTVDLLSLLLHHRVEAIVNFAAETHVDRSILDPLVFVRTNILGIQNILSAMQKIRKIRLLHVSTDEVYGSLAQTAEPFTEETPLSPNSPYAASKASADFLGLASFRTFGQEVLISRCSNNFGPYQFPEKLIPLVIANALEDRAIPIYGNGKQVRDWIYVEDHCEALHLLLWEGKAGEIYNISAGYEKTNLDLVTEILKMIGKNSNLIQHVKDRPAHDERYRLNSEKLRRELDWKPQFSFEAALQTTVEWYCSNREWWEKIRDEKYEKYYCANYESKGLQVKEY